MSQMLPNPVECCKDPCRDTLVVNIPGAPGVCTNPCTDGIDGENAYTLTTASFEMPAEGGTVIIEVLNSDWMVESATPQGLIFIQGAGTFQVVDIPDSTHAEIKNIADAANGIYPDNHAPGLPLISAGQRVSPTGIQGPQGETPVDALLASNNLSDVDDVPTARANLGLTRGTGNAEIAPVDEVGGLDAGEAVFATASGIETKDDVSAFDTISPLTTEGDLLTHDGTNNVRLGVGTANQVVSTDGTDVMWKSISSVLSGGLFTDDAALVAAATVEEFTHGLSGTPQIVNATLVCVSAELGYSADDEIDLAGCQGTGDNNFCVVERDATKIRLIYDGTGPCQIRRQSAPVAALANIDFTKWNLKVYALRI